MLHIQFQSWEDVYSAHPKVISEDEETGEKVWEWVSARGRRTHPHFAPVEIIFRSMRRLILSFLGRSEVFKACSIRAAKAYQS